MEQYKMTKKNIFFVKNFSNLAQKVFILGLSMKDIHLLDVLLYSCTLQCILYINCTFVLYCIVAILLCTVQYIIWYRPSYF